MEITKDTKVSEILREYGDIADVMEVFGIKRVGRYSFRSFITKVITVERAAKIHHVPLDEFLDILHTAVGDGPDEPHQEGSHDMTDEPTLDIRSEPPANRHAVIFKRFDALAPGAGFVLVNDHDPKPLYYQMAAEQPGTFTWDYLEEGPEVWRVRIGRAGAPSTDPGP